MPSNFTPASRSAVEARVIELPTYVDHGKTGTGLIVELDKSKKAQGWTDMVESYGWYIDRIMFIGVVQDNFFVFIFPITEVPDGK